MGLVSLKVRAFTADIPSGDDPPKEFLLFSFGATGTTKGEYTFDKEAAAKVLSAAAEYGNRLTIDYEHQALSDPPVIAPSAGSFALELRDDGLYAVDVRWTERAATMLRSKEYLYTSPAFVPDDKGRPSRLLNVALTNLPATRNMQSLVAASQLTEVKTMNKLLTVLSLKETATEDEAVTALGLITKERENLIALTGKSNAAEALGVIAGWKASAEKVEALTAQLAEVAAAKLKAEVGTMLDDAVREGRVTPAKRDEFQALADKHGPDALKACLSVLPKAPAPAIELKTETTPPTVPGAELTASQLKIIKQLGLTVEQYREYAPKYMAIINPTEEK